VSRPSGNGDEGWWIFAAVTAALAAAAGAWSAQALAARFDATPSPPNPIATVIGAFTGKHPWPPAATKWALLELAAVVVLALVVLVVWSSRRGRRLGIDRRSRHLTVDRQGITRYLGTPRGPEVFAGDGPPIGLLIRNGKATRQMVRMAWEDVGVIIAGPRTGKTTSIAIPAICMAPAAVVATSNMSDL